MVATHLCVSPGLEAHGLDSIVMEAIPLGKMLSSMLTVLFIPLQHTLLEVDVGSIAVTSDRLLWVVQHIIRIHDRQVLPVDEPLLDQKVKQPHELLVPSLVGHEVVEARDLLQRRDRTPVVRGDGAARMADEEGEVKFAKDVERDGGWIHGVVLAAATAEGVGNAGSVTVGGEEVVGHVLDEDALTLAYM